MPPATPCAWGNQSGCIEQVSHDPHRNLTRACLIEVYVVIEDGRVFRQFGIQVYTVNAGGGTDGQ